MILTRFVPSRGADPCPSSPHPQPCAIYLPRAQAGLQPLEIKALFAISALYRPLLRTSRLYAM